MTIGRFAQLSGLSPKALDPEALDPEALDGNLEEGAALMEAGWQDLDRAVAQSGGTASSAWTTVRPRDGRDPGQVVLCLGLDRPWPAGPDWNARHHPADDPAGRGRGLRRVGGQRGAGEPLLRAGTVSPAAW